METTIFRENDADLSLLKNKTISVIGYGNQAKAQALNMRDSELNVIIGISNEKYKMRADKDGFETFSIAEAVKRGDFIFLLLPDKDMKEIFEKQVISHLNKQKTLIFSDGYYVAFSTIEVPKDIDVLLITPLALGEVVRKQFINKEGFFTFIGITQNSSRNALNHLLALTKAIGGLKKAAIKMSFMQQTSLKLFAEQTFRAAFNQVLMRAIKNLMEAGYPAEAIYIELILSEEMIYTVDKMINVGLIKQMNFHSQTSQYGSLSRGVKYAKVGGDIDKIHKKILQYIEKGQFSQEWEHYKNTAKLNIMKYFAFTTNFSKLEQEVYKNLNYSIPEKGQELKLPSKEQLTKYKELRTTYETYKKFYSQF